MTDKIGPAGRAVIGALLCAFDAAKEQLPAGMRECTILYIECPQGHGRLTATNWIDHGCQTCEMQALEKAGDILAHQLQFSTYPGELEMWWKAREGKCTYCDFLGETDNHVRCLRAR